MRFFIIFISLVCVPAMMAVHLGYFISVQQPKLEQQAAEVLESCGVRVQRLDMRFLQLSVAGNAPDPESAAQAQRRLEEMAPWILDTDHLLVPAHISLVQDGDHLTVSGWLPAEEQVRQTAQLLAKLRPDLELDLTGLHYAPQVRWPEGEHGPLTAESSLVKPWLEQLRVRPWLLAKRDADGQFMISGVLPASGLRAQILQALALNESQAAALRESVHTTPAAPGDTDFARNPALPVFLADYFSVTGARSFLVNEQGEPVLTGSLTRPLEARWLAALRPVFGGRRVQFQGDVFPSLYHFPGRKLETPLPAEQLDALQKKLSALHVTFDAGSRSLGQDVQASLAAMAGDLVSAGPTLRLVIGGHPDPGGSSASAAALAMERAQQVRAFLVEQGLPALDVIVMAFEHADSAAARPSEVELLIR